MPLVSRIAAVLPLVLAVTAAAEREEVAGRTADPDYHVARATEQRPPGVEPPIGAPGFRVQIKRPELADAVRRAVEGATGRLQRRGCSSIFTGFSDAEGTALQSRLDELGLTGAEYLGQIGFHDGQGGGRCGPSHILAFTIPGSRIVWFCSSFTPLTRKDPGLAEAVVLHEALHSLGLGENPPSSLEVTAEIVKHCGR